MTAPVTVLVATDARFYDKLPELFPYADAKSWFTSSDAVAHETAFRNSSLQAAYLIMACRSLGLDTGPMSGFDVKQVDELFLQGQIIILISSLTSAMATLRKFIPAFPV